MPYDKHELHRIRQRLNQPAVPPSAVQRLEPPQPALPDPFDE
jgi:hypothetical protein